MRIEQIIHNDAPRKVEVLRGHLYNKIMSYRRMAENMFAKMRVVSLVGLVFLVVAACDDLLVFTARAQSTPPATGPAQPPSSIPPPQTLPPTGQTDPNTTPDFNRPEGQGQALGKYRVQIGKNDVRIKVTLRLTDVYKSSVVRVIARDEAGNPLNQAMGVAVGVTSNNLKVGDSIYVATPLSLILGNALQWADRIQIVQENGASLEAKVALIDEQIDLVLLKPEASPSPLRFVPPENERAQLTVVTIGFEDKKDENGLPSFEAKGHEATLSAINVEEGTLAVSGPTIDNRQAGTAILNLQGQLMGMLLPNSKGVLASGLYKAIRQARGKKPIHPRLVGAIMGRGVLVDPRLKGAYKTIQEALDDIAEGKAPKPDPTRFLRAYTDEFRPKDPPRPILKIAPGTYTIEDTLKIPSNLSVSGSGPKETIVRMEDGKKPLFDLEGTSNTAIANFRMVPGEEQDPKVATVRINNSKSIVLLGNLIEARGGRAVHVTNSNKIALFGNSFPKGTSKGVYCQISNMKVEANAFLGEWPQAMAVGKTCRMQSKRNIFMRNQISVAISSESVSLSLSNNTFIASNAAIRFFGDFPAYTIEDNLFYRNKFSLLSQLPVDVKKVGRNGSYKSVAFQDGKMIQGLDYVRGKPEFRKPEKYDFRLLPGSPNVGAGIPERNGTPTDIGAFQPTQFLGKYTSHLLSTLSVALGEENLASEWGFKE